MMKKEILSLIRDTTIIFDDIVFLGRDAQKVQHIRQTLEILFQMVNKLELKEQAQPAKEG